jgi:hypothetical protein
VWIEHSVALVDDAFVDLVYDDRHEKSPHELQDRVFVVREFWTQFISMDDLDQLTVITARKKRFDDNPELLVQTRTTRRDEHVELVTTEYLFDRTKLDVVHYLESRHETGAPISGNSLLTQVVVDVDSCFGHCQPPRNS